MNYFLCAVVLLIGIHTGKVHAEESIEHGTIQVESVTEEKEDEKKSKKKHATEKKQEQETVEAEPTYEEEMEDLGTVQVESSTIDDRFESKRSEPSNVAVISGEKLDNAHVQNLQEVLRAIPGLTVESRPGGDSLKIHIRGVENQRYMGEKPGVAVVIDGVPVFERTGRVNIDIDNIESIKVIKGGASYLFGEDALSGAVVITTKRGAKMAGYKFDIEGGTFGYLKGLVRAGVSTDKFSAHVQGSHRKIDGYHEDSGSTSRYYNGKAQYYFSDLTDLTFGFEHSKRKKDSHGTVKGVISAKENPESIDLGDGLGRDYTRKYDVALEKYFLNFFHEVDEDSNLMMNLYHFSDTTSFLSAPQKFDAAGQAVTAVDAYLNGIAYDQVQRGFKAEWRSGFDKFGYMAAIDLRRNAYKEKSETLVDYKTSARSRTIFREGTKTQDDDTLERMYAGYGEVVYKPWSNLAITGNARFDRIKLDYKDLLQNISLAKAFHVFSSRIGANYNVTDNWDIYSNMSSGFRTPTASQLFAGDINPTGNTASNPDLKPEKAINIELGTRGRGELFGVGFEVDAAIFQINRKDFILAAAGQYSTPETGVMDKYENIGGVRSRGFELAVNTDKSKLIYFDLAYTYLKTKFTDYQNFNLTLGNPYRNPTIVSYNNTGNEVPRVPRHHLNLTGTITPLPGLTTALEWDVQSESYADELNWIKIPGHGTLNFLLNYDFKWKNKNVAFFTRIENVLDQPYWNNARSHGDTNYDGVYDDHDVSITMDPGTTVTVGVSMTF